MAAEAAVILAEAAISVAAISEVAVGTVAEDGTGEAAGMAPTSAASTTSTTAASASRTSTITVASSMAAITRTTTPIIITAAGSSGPITVCAGCAGIGTGTAGTTIIERHKRRGRPPGALFSNPIFELPVVKLDLPRRQFLQPPLLEMLGRPVAELLLLLRRDIDHRTLGRTPPVLARRIRDQIDEIRLVPGHGRLLAETRGVCALPVKEPLPKPVQLERRVYCLHMVFSENRFTLCANAALRVRIMRYRQSLTSTKCPAIAAAAAIAGETRCVRPLKPWRPSKLRFEVEAQRSSGASLSGFMARHIEQPGSRHSKPALMKILSRPSASACSFTMPEPGTTIALTCALTVLPSAILATARRSSMRPLVQEPMKTRSSLMSVFLVPAVRPIYFSARCLESRLASSSILSGSGTMPVTEMTSSGEVPQVTIGGSLAASRRIS